jgi:hypothetical protein
MQMQNLTRDLVARQLPAANQASLSLASKDWQRAAKPHLDMKRALVRVADVRRRAAFEHFAELLDSGMTDWMNRLAVGDVPAGFVAGTTWYVLKKHGMKLSIRRGPPRFRHEDIVLLLEVPRQGLILQVAIEPLRVFLVHGADSADTARTYATQLRNAGIAVPLRVELDPGLYAERPRRGNPRA